MNTTTATKWHRTSPGSYQATINGRAYSVQHIPSGKYSACWMVSVDGNRPDDAYATKRDAQAAAVLLATAGSQAQAGVNGSFTAPRTKRQKDLHDYMGMMRRVTRAAGERIALEDPSELASLVALRAELDATIARTAKALHDTKDANGNSFSWDDIGQALGVTRQAAYQKFGR